MTAAASGTFPRLSRDVVTSDMITSDRVVLPERTLLELPEKAVQFGTGAFLRGFVDYFLDEANRRGEFGGRVVAIGSTSSGRDVGLSEQDGLYTLVVEGTGDTGLLRECRVIASVSRALSAQQHWNDVLSLARTPAIEIIFSNTTEVGIAIDEGDRQAADPPPSFPAKLTRFLFERGRAFQFADDAGVVVVPCELIERNGERLRELVLTLARRWELDPAFASWIERAVPFCNTLVDRIVPGRPHESARSELERSLGYRDDMMIAAESYRLFVIEADAETRGRLSFAKADDGIILTEDVTPYRERKVRILNGGHTLLASVGLLMGCQTVLEAMRHEQLGKFLRRVLYDEIVPSLTAPNGEGFAHDVLSRFANPFLRHALLDITTQHTAKFRVRVVPSIIRFADRSGAVPPLLAFGFAAYLLFIRQSLIGDPAVRPRRAADNDAERVLAVWRSVSDDSDLALRDVAQRVCADEELWQNNLTRVAGFADRVGDDLIQMTRLGVAPVLAARLEGAGRVTPDLVSS